MSTCFSSKGDRSYERAQAMVEFAIVLPILMMLLVGILEVGRMVFIYASVTNASRDAVRYASAYGLADGGLHNKYQYCAGIRDVARKSALMTSLPDSAIKIYYDKGPTYYEGAPFDDECPAGVTSDTSVTAASGDRVVVQITVTYRPMVNLIPIGQRTFTSTSARTILGILELAYP